MENWEVRLTARRKYKQRDPRLHPSGVVHPLRRLSERAGVCREDIRYKRLGVAVDEREPGRLDVDHNAVAFLEVVADIGHRPGNFGWLVRRHRFGTLEGAAELGAHGLAAHHELITAALETFPLVLLVRRLVRIDV